MKAEECKCCVCGKPAVALWPVVDPDIPANPYCRECLDKEKIKMLISTFNFSENEAKLFTKQYNNKD